MHTTSEYLHTIFNPKQMAATFAWLKKQVEKERDAFDCIAFRGASGGPAFALGALLGIPILHVRKDMGHSHSRIEGCWAGDNRIAIVDDFLQTGTTVHTIMRELHSFQRERCIIPHVKLTRCFLYSLNGSWPDGYKSVLQCNEDCTIIARCLGGPANDPRVQVRGDEET